MEPLCFMVLIGALTAVTTATPAPGTKTVDDRVQEFRAATTKRWAPFFKQAGVPYPPRAVAFVGLKQEKVLQVYGTATNGTFRFIRSFPILAASGKPGPKLREGDLQVPEGIYRIDSLNPNSKFHVSLRVNYPNEDDRARAKAENRSKLGGDIMIHGNAVSVGCLAMGDEAAEDLFLLAALTGLANIEVILSPLDFRSKDLREMPPGAPKWAAERYATIKAALARYPKPDKIPPP